MKDGTDWDDRNEKDQIEAATEAREADEATDGSTDEDTRVADTEDLGLDADEEEGEEGQSPAVFGPTPVFGNARDLIDRYSHCVVCRSRLHFTHLTDFSRNLSQEIAKCPECNLKVRRVTHRLQ